MYKPDRVHGGVKEQGLCFWAFNRSCSSLHKTNGSKKRDSWLLVMKPEREDKLCEEMAMRLSALSLHKTTDNVIFIPLPRPASPTSPLQPSFSISYFPLHPFSFPFPFLIFNYTDPPGVDPGKPGKPGTRSLDRVTSRVGFKNYSSDWQNIRCINSKICFDSMIS